MAVTIENLRAIRDLPLEGEAPDVVAIAERVGVEVDAAENRLASLAKDGAVKADEGIYSLTARGKRPFNP